MTRGKNFCCSPGILKWNADIIICNMDLKVEMRIKNFLSRSQTIIQSQATYIIDLSAVSVAAKPRQEGLGPDEEFQTQCVPCNESLVRPAALLISGRQNFLSAIIAILEDLLNIYCAKVSIVAIILSLFRIQFFAITHKVHYLLITHDR